MSDTPKFFNPTESKKPTQKKEKEKKESSLKKILFKKQEQKSTRSIRFVKRGVVNFISYFFWLLFVFSLFFNFIAYSRYGLVLRKVNQKEIDPQEIVSELNSSKELENRATYESEQFLTQLFTYNQDKIEERTTYLDSKLANGLTDTMLMSNSTKTNQQVTSIDFVDSELISYDRSEYAFIFDVKIKSDDKQEQLQLSLPISIKNGDFKVVNYPTYLNVERSDNLEKNDSYYQENNYLTKGEKLEHDQKKALESFTQDFFKLYVGNDDSLKLVSNVKGLDNADLRNVLIKNIVKKDKYFIVEGTFNASFNGTSEITSFFSLKIDKSKDTYFVTKIN